MGFLDSLKKALGTGTSSDAGAGRSKSGDDAWAYWVYAQCRRCGEPLRTRVDMRNDLSEEDAGTWVVRKGLTGSGKYYCFQTVEVVLHFDQAKKTVLDSDAVGGKLIAADEYPARLLRWQEEQARQAEERAQQ
jgi:hypothetical protein